MRFPGPISRHAGNILSKRSNVRNTIGSTEILAMPLFQVPSDDWEYFHSDPELKGLEFQPRGEELYELVLVRHPSTDPYHSAFITFPELHEYPMKDLFSKHPTKPNYWLYVGRADDVIVLSNGEKLNPTSMEARLRDHPSVSGALVVGQGKFSTAAVIELRSDIAKTIQSAESRARFIESLWPYAVSGNKKAPGHAQLAQDRIILASPQKPFMRAAKGTIQRAATVKLFEQEIEELYQRTDEEDMPDIPKIDINRDIKSLEEELQRLVGSVAGIEGLERDQDFFSSGMDSLHVMTLIKRLKSVLVGGEIPHEKISTRTIYTNPTIATLAAALKAIDISANGITKGDTLDKSRERKMEVALEKYLRTLPVPSAKKSKHAQDGLTVLLTGSTGSLGSYLLDSLAKSSKVVKIYCLNRRPDAEQVQAKTNAARGLISSWGKKFVFLQTDLSKPDLGLPNDVYQNLVNETSVIIRKWPAPMTDENRILILRIDNQWQVDFNLSLPSFELHICGTSNLIKLSALSPNSPPIFFTSSIGTVGHWREKHPNQLVPEIALSDASMPEFQGYSESKWISERLLDAAAQNCGVSAAICRVGQIAGPVDENKGGVWNRQEWLPSVSNKSRNGADLD